MQVVILEKISASDMYDPPPGIWVTCVSGEAVAEPVQVLGPISIGAGSTCLTAGEFAGTQGSLQRHLSHV